MGASPISVPSGSPGSQAGAMSKVREAINILQAALPEFPPGSDPHKAVLSAISNISKYVQPSAEVPGVQQSALRDLQGQAQKSGMLQQVMSSLGGGAAGQGGGGAPPPGMPAAA